MVRDVVEIAVLVRLIEDRTRGVFNATGPDSTLTMGQGPDVLLLHGLGGTRASLFDAAAALSRS